MTAKKTRAEEKMQLSVKDWRGGWGSGAAVSLARHGAVETEAKEKGWERYEGERLKSDTSLRLD